MKNNIIASIQLIPLGTADQSKAALEKIQTDIEQCGLPMKKEQFGYVLEGQYESIMRICEALQLAAFNAGTERIEMIIKIRSVNGKNLSLKDS